MTTEREQWLRRLERGATVTVCDFGHISAVGTIEAVTAHFIHAAGPKFRRDTGVAWGGYGTLTPHEAWHDQYASARASA